MMKISPGEYELPEGHTATRMGKYLIVRPLTSHVADHVCLLCKNRVEGKWMDRQWFRSFVCEKKPKLRSDGSVKKGLFYAVKDYGGKDCPMFKKR